MKSLQSELTKLSEAAKRLILIWIAQKNVCEFYKFILPPPFFFLFQISRERDMEERQKLTDAIAKLKKSIADDKAAVRTFLEN